MKYKILDFREHRSWERGTGNMEEIKKQVYLTLPKKRYNYRLVSGSFHSRFWRRYLLTLEIAKDKLSRARNNVFV